MQPFDQTTTVAHVKNITYYFILDFQPQYVKVLTFHCNILDSFKQ